MWNDIMDRRWKDRGLHAHYGDRTDTMPAMGGPSLNCHFCTVVLLPACHHLPRRGCAETVFLWPGRWVGRWNRHWKRKHAMPHCVWHVFLASDPSSVSSPLLFSSPPHPHLALPSLPSIILCYYLLLCICFIPFALLFVEYYFPLPEEDVSYYWSR